MAKTPAQRIIEHESTPKEVVQAIQRAMEENNPYDMADMVEKGLRKIWKAIREMNAEAPNNQIKRDEIAEKYGKLQLQYTPIVYPSKED